MAIANETHKYHTKQLALVAAAQWCDMEGLDLDDFVVCPAQVDGVQRFGWVPADMDATAEDAEPVKFTLDGADDLPLADTAEAESGSIYSPSQIGFMLAGDDSPAATAEPSTTDAPLFLRLGPFSDDAAILLAKKLRKYDGAIVDAAGAEREVFGPKARAAAKVDKPDKPARIRVGMERDALGRPIRPYITHDGHRKHCDKLMDKVDVATRVSLMELIALGNLPGFVACDTYHKQVMAYRENHMSYWAEHGCGPDYSLPANDAAELQDAAD